MQKPQIIEDDPLLDTREMAELLGVKPETLENWRTTKRYALPYIKVGRCVRYRKSDGQKFLDARTVAA